MNYIAFFLALVLPMMFAVPADAAETVDDADEMFFYRGDGLFRYYNVKRMVIWGLRSWRVRVTPRVGIRLQL